VDIDPAATSPCDREIVVTFEFLTAVVLELKRKELALVNIVDEMYNKCLLRETDKDRCRANHLVFAALGWISASRSVSPLIVKAANMSEQASYIPHLRVLSPTVSNWMIVLIVTTA
jgi:hypothetical protein